MFKLVVLAAAIIAYASAGVIQLDDGYGVGSFALAAPKVIAAPAAIAVKAGATSYQNSNLLALHPTPVVTKAVAAPIAAPVITKVAVAAPAVSVVGLDGHFGLGGYGSVYGKY